MEHFFSPNLGEDQKKRSSPKSGTLSFPEFRWRPALRCTPESNYWEDISPPGLGTPDCNRGKFTLNVQHKVPCSFLINRGGKRGVVTS